MDFNATAAFDLVIAGLSIVTCKQVDLPLLMVASCSIY